MALGSKLKWLLKWDETYLDFVCDNFIVKLFSLFSYFCCMTSPTPDRVTDTAMFVIKRCFLKIFDMTSIAIGISKERLGGWQYVTVICT